ncbi:multisubunit Na+/H+ antiporter MnhF subunit [Streptomyces sp. 1114.5]|uniref:monovalent cation/H+ antiporter complex subunit F n=1 Tax=unclassified Streptomyces TaxID=2593676 RepID=UPI000BCE7C08|nr:MULTISPECIES: monovalent cation/H+ antiporter complex subunit F [unclassified Streptomyces]RKT09458.1 multisubunit Na+/H+ antiporter MnhF subunit [Streptomyces sp. 1114.5]SOB88538.1 Multisubunit Na+/H+ antiporter, MnhF subunit [Streptomyces sp. 1331.2]
MNAWLLAAAFLGAGGVAPCLLLGLRGEPPQRLAGLNLAATLTSVLLLLLAQGFSRSSYTDLALDLAVLAPAGTLVFTRFLAGEEH